MNDPADLDAEREAEAAQANESAPDEGRDDAAERLQDEQEPDQNEP